MFDNILSIQSLYIAQTEETPEVNFNVETGKLLLRGRSLPEDAFSFFKPLIDWSNKYFEQTTGEVNFEIQLDYFNSSSGRYLMELLVKMEVVCTDHLCVKITWKVEEDDEVMIEKGEEFRDLVDIPFEIVKF